jgi:hypothetical protein
VLIFLSKEKFFLFAIVLPSVEKKRKNERESKRERERREKKRE